MISASRSSPRQRNRSSSAVARGAVVTRQQPTRLSPSKVARTVWLLPMSTVSSTAQRSTTVAAPLTEHARGRRRRVAAQLDDAVGAVDVHDARDVALRLGLVHDAVADQDHQVAGVHEVRGGAVDADDAAAALARDHVGLQAGAVGDVDDRDLLAGQQVGGVEQVLVDRHRAHVVQVGLGDGGAVDLGLEHRAHHRGSPRVDGDVVEESGGAGAGGDQQAGGAGGGRRAEIGIGELEVVLDERRLGGQHRAGGGEHRVGAVAARRRPRRAARPRSSAAAARCSGVEVAVAAGQRHAVVLADGRHADDLDAERQLPRHGPDQRELLVVLLAEERDVGPDQAEQLGDDGQHAGEVARAHRALEHRRPAGPGRR